MITPYRRILVIRRDNIGDLVCTTPLIRRLKEQYPAAEIYALVNSYNAPALQGNPSLDGILWYDKAKHLSGTAAKMGAYWRRLRLVSALRSMAFDLAVLAAPGFQPRSLRWAELAQARQVLGFASNREEAGQLTLPVMCKPDPALHEAEDVFKLLVPLGIAGSPGRPEVFPKEILADKLLNSLASPLRSLPLVGIHISARKPSQQWPIERYAELMSALHAGYNVGFLLFWSPGKENNPLHPGDDDKAERLISMVSRLPMQPMPTKTLEDLIAGLSLCKTVICSDGGAMHLAAGLAKPIVCFFGRSSAQRWHPWGVDYELLQPVSHEAEDISVTDAAAAFSRLNARMRVTARPR